VGDGPMASRSSRGDTNLDGTRDDVTAGPTERPPPALPWRSWARKRRDLSCPGTASPPQRRPWPWRQGMSQLGLDSRKATPPQTSRLGDDVKGWSVDWWLGCPLG